MKQNSLILIAVIALCATSLGVFERSGSVEKDITVPAKELSSPILGKDRREPQTEPTVSPMPKSAKDLSYVLKLKNGQVEFELTNMGTSSHLFYGKSLSIRALGVPDFAGVQVLKEDGSLFDSWNSSIQGDSWTPLLVSSDVRTSLPAKSQTIGPGETRSLRVPIEKFFGSADFDPKAENYRVRVVSHLYLDAYLSQHIESRTEWVPLKH